MQRLSNAPESKYLAAGFNNSICFIIPDWDMIVVRIGAEGRPSNSCEIWNNFFNKLGDAKRGGAVSFASRMTQ